MTGPIVRAAMPDDAALVLGLILEGFAGYRDRLLPPSSAFKENLDSIGAALASGGAGLAMLERVTVGTVLWQPRSDSLYLGRLAVLPAWRRRGVAQALAGFVEAEARRRGFPAVTLGVRVALLDNIRFFTRCGYVEIGRSTHAGWAEPTSIDMRKTLE